MSNHILKSIVRIVFAISLILICGQSTLLASNDEDCRFAVYPVEDYAEPTARSFQFVDYETQKPVRGYYNPKPIITLEDLIMVQTGSQEFSSAPVTVLKLTFGTTVSEKLDGLNIKDAKKKAFVIVFNCNPIAKVSSEELRDKGGIFVITPTHTDLDVKVLTKHVTEIFGKKLLPRDSR